MVWRLWRLSTSAEKLLVSVFLLVVAYLFFGRPTVLWLTSLQPEAQLTAVNAALVFTTAWILFSQLGALQKTAESAAYDAHFQSAMAYYRTVIENPAAYRSIFNDTANDDDVRKRFVAFGLLRLWDNYYLQHASGSFPSSTDDELWHLWDNAVRKTISGNAYLREQVVLNAESFSRELQKLARRSAG